MSKLFFNQGLRKISTRGYLLALLQHTSALTIILWLEAERESLVHTLRESFKGRDAEQYILDSCLLRMMDNGRVEMTSAVYVDNIFVGDSGRNQALLLSLPWQVLSAEESE